MGPEGDTFSYQYNSSDNFYGSIVAHTTRAGTIVFQVPTAATSGLRLLYRPEIATETGHRQIKHIVNPSMQEEFTLLIEEICSSRSRPDDLVRRGVGVLVSST